MAEPTGNNITFFSKKPIPCPLCGCVFQREELQTGRGRINAGELTRELRRLYIPTQKYGAINPLLYPLSVCPQCLFAGLPSDFQKLTEDNIIEGERENRALALQKIFGRSVDFSVPRDLLAGLASYILGFMSTVHLEKNSSPTARRGLYSLRAAWLATDLHKKTTLKHFDDLSEELYRQALNNYEGAMEKQLRNIEPFDGFIWMGPDVDTNFGYDGVIYVISMLLFRQMEFTGRGEKVKKLETIKRNLSRVFGMGRSNKDKPEILVTYTKELYAQVNEEIQALASQGVDVSSAINIAGVDDVHF